MGIEVEGLSRRAGAPGQVLQAGSGRRILGYISLGRGITIHRDDCPNARALQKNPERFTPVSWGGANRQGFRVEIAIDAWDRPRLLEDLSRSFAESGVNIVSANCHMENQMVHDTLRRRRRRHRQPQGRRQRAAQGGERLRRLPGHAGLIRLGRAAPGATAAHGSAERPDNLADRELVESPDAVGGDHRHLLGARAGGAVDSPRSPDPADRAADRLGRIVGLRPLARAAQDALGTLRADQPPRPGDRGAGRPIAQPTHRRTIVAVVVGALIVLGRMVVASATIRPRGPRDVGEVTTPPTSDNPDHDADRQPRPSPVATSVVRERGHAGREPVGDDRLGLQRQRRLGCRRRGRRPEALRGSATRIGDGRQCAEARSPVAVELDPVRRAGQRPDAACSVATALGVASTHVAPLTADPRIHGRQCRRRRAGRQGHRLR